GRCVLEIDTGVVSIGTESQTMIVEKLANKFLREARSLNKLSHPNIVRVSDVFEENGTNYYVMDYIEGRSLHAAMYYDGPLSEARMMNYMTQIMDALEYLHSRNMLHLDIKPDNIMVDAKDRAILIDFGVAKQYGDGTNDGNSTVMGQTPGFAPLEQMSNNVKAFSAATDIYALGATMYALLTGVTPPTAPELASGVAELQPLPPYISDNVRRTLAAMMEIKNSERLQSIAEVRSMLAGKPLPAGRKPGLGQQPTAKVGVGVAGAVPHQPTKPLEGNSAPQLPIDFSRVSDNRSNGKKKGLLIGIIAISAAILVGLGVFLFLQFAGSDKDKTDTIALTDTNDNAEDLIVEEETEQTTDTEEPAPSPAPANNAANTDTQSSAQASTAGQAAATTSTATTTTTNEAAATNNNNASASTASTNNSTSAASSGFISTPAISAPKYVDMGNGMYWASCNIGASSSHDSGWYRSLIHV
ncbi:MAG: serine/threonine protein kinase, partial [Muribaculaceae bacterium]|nr:serine/threonine protein kinase [Muribaculaceae bacterium]